MRIKVMTFNIMSGKNHMDPEHPIDIPIMAEAVNSVSPDIVGFNEVRFGPGGPGTPVFPRYHDEPAELAQLIGGECVFAKALDVGDGKGYGNAMLSKLPLLKTETVMIPDPPHPEDEKGYETRCILRGLIQTDKGPITVLSSHFGLKRDEQVNAVDTALAIVNSCGTPAILMGDFNMGDYDDLIKKIANVMTDAAAKAGNTGPTFPSDAPRGRIDYIFVKGFEVINCAPVQFVASDHFPLMAELEL